MKYATAAANFCTMGGGFPRRILPVTFPVVGILVSTLLLPGWDGVVLPVAAQSAPVRATSPLGRDREPSGSPAGVTSASVPAQAAVSSRGGDSPGLDRTATSSQKSSSQGDQPASRPRRVSRPSSRRASRLSAESRGTGSGEPRESARPSSEAVSSPAASRSPEVIVTSESITHRIRLAPNGVVVVEFPLADAIYAIHPGNQNIIEVDIDQNSKPNDPLVFRPGPAFDPVLKTQTVHSLQFVSGLFVTLIFEPTQRIEENDHRVILQYDIAAIRAARARKGLATNFLRRPVSPLMDEDPRIQTMPSVVPLNTSVNLEPVASAATSPGASRPGTDPIRDESSSGGSGTMAAPGGKLAASSSTNAPPSTPGTSPGVATGSLPDSRSGAGSRGAQGDSESKGNSSSLSSSPVPSSTSSPAPSLSPSLPAPSSTPSPTPSLPVPSSGLPPAPSSSVSPVSPSVSPTLPTPPVSRAPSDTPAHPKPVPGKNISLLGAVGEPYVTGVISGETGTLVMPAASTGTSFQSRSASRSRQGGGADTSDRAKETPLQQLDDVPTPRIQLDSPSRLPRNESGVSPITDNPAVPRRNMTAAEREKYRLITEYYQTLGISVATIHRLRLDLEEKITSHRERRSVDWLASLDTRTAQKNFPRWPVMVSFVDIADDADFPGIRRYILSITVHEKASRPLYINSLDPDIFIITRNERVIVNTERLVPLVTLAGNPTTVIRPGETAYFGVAIPRPTLSDNQMLEIAFIDAEKANRPILAREFRTRR